MNARRPLLLALLLLSLAARADLVVVVNADNPTPALSREEVIHIFLGRYRQFPSGQGAEPYDQPTDSPERNLFYERLVGKSQAQINAYWARLTFTGRTRPPWAPAARINWSKPSAGTPTPSATWIVRASTAA